MQELNLTTYFQAEGLFPKCIKDATLIRATFSSSEKPFSIRVFHDEVTLTGLLHRHPLTGFLAPEGPELGNYALDVSQLQADTKGTTAAKCATNIHQ